MKRTWIPTTHRAAEGKAVNSLAADAGEKVNAVMGAAEVLAEGARAADAGSASWLSVSALLA